MSLIENPMAAMFDSPKINAISGVINAAMIWSTIALKYNAITNPMATTTTSPLLMNSLYSKRNFFMRASQARPRDRRILTGRSIPRRR